ncbi:Hypothetical predicted protein [Cloeon dipterum]|uniref:Uncharacterized protein n=1 Tax=Cloeon dipterum TaxID=197152 RepID=A0A8S1DZH4_9INSE|nr:Hypothetical predicted protein [Cloeon dipterum]
MKNKSIQTKFKMNRNDEETSVENFVPSLLSLQELAINTILKNIGGYRDLITKKISPPMRKILFENAMERKKEIGEDQVWAALPYLDPHKTTESFSTKDFLSIFRLQRKFGSFTEACVSMEEFLQYLVEFVPNLQQLDIEDPRMAYQYSERRMLKKIRLQPLATDLLIKMQNLTKVRIHNVNIKFSGFVRVCKESRNLNIIEAQNILVDIEPITSMKNILEMLAHKFDYQEYDEWKFPRKIRLTLKKTNDVKPPRVAVVSLSKDFLDLIPFGLMKLHISAWETVDFRSERNRLLRNLRRLGGTLKVLYFVFLRSELNITFKHVFDHCHELESLLLLDSFMSLEDPIASFGQLKRFNWLSGDGVEQLRYWTVELDKIFSAPLLQDIAICTYAKIDLGDKELLLNRIRNRKILTNLTKLHIFYHPNLNDEEFHELAHELRSFGCDMSSSDEDSDVERFFPSLLSLQESAINTILENIGRYRDLITKKISPPMRKILFDKAMKRKNQIGEDQVWAALPYLDQHKTTERFSTKDFATIFRLKKKSGGFSEASVSMEEFLQYLFEFVPNLQQLEIDDPRMAYSYYERKIFKIMRLQPLAIDLLLKMENLTEVRIHDVYIKFTDFVRVCSVSRSLQSIQANNILVDMQPTNSMKKILETVASKFDYQKLPMLHLIEKQRSLY